LYGGGVDKLPLDEREKYVIEHMSDVADSATNPLGGRKWWQEAEDPWQCLAACLELNKAMQASDPEAFESRLPVQQVRHAAAHCILSLGG
jgi:DNA-directed RNA polymerase